MKDEAAVDSRLLTLPNCAGIAIVEASSLIACPVLGTNRFVSYCRDRGVTIDRERLIRLERIGLSAPLFRVRTPDQGVSPMRIPLTGEDSWFSSGWAWDTTNPDKITKFRIIRMRRKRVITQSFR